MHFRSTGILDKTDNPLDRTCCGPASNKYKDLINRNVLFYMDVPRLYWMGDKTCMLIQYKTCIKDGQYLKKRPELQKLMEINSVKD